MGGKSIEGFSLAMRIGVGFGTYSTGAIAAPLLLRSARQAFSPPRLRSIK